MTKITDDPAKRNKSADNLKFPTVKKKETAHPCSDGQFYNDRAGKCELK